MHQSKLVILYSIGMVKSPVEGNSIVLLKLDQPIVFSDFARPVCIPDQDEFIDESVKSNCVTLGWSLDTDELAKVSILLQDCKNPLPQALDIIDPFDIDLS